MFYYSFLNVVAIVLVTLFLSILLMLFLVFQAVLLQYLDVRVNNEWPWVAEVDAVYDKRQGEMMLTSHHKGGACSVAGESEKETRRGGEERGRGEGRMMNRVIQ